MNQGNTGHGDLRQTETFSQEAGLPSGASRKKAATTKTYGCFVVSPGDLVALERGDKANASYVFSLDGSQTFMPYEDFDRAHLRVEMQELERFAADVQLKPEDRALPAVALDDVRQALQERGGQQPKLSAEQQQEVVKLFDKKPRHECGGACEKV